MTESHPVYRLTQEAYDQLRLAADENPNSYLDPESDFAKVLRERGVCDPFEETCIATDKPISLTPVAEGGIPNLADRQALDFYNSFEVRMRRVTTAKGSALIIAGLLAVFGHLACRRVPTNGQRSKRRRLGLIDTKRLNDAL